jgi:dsDNA-binding SOS-regulon protein
VRRLLPLALAAGLLGAPAASAEEDLTKQQIVNRSGPICKDLLEAIQPYVEKGDKARAKEQWDRFIRQSRLAISTARSYGSELRRLRPATGARRYGRFLDQARAALNWLERALEALEDERIESATTRQATAQEHFARARRAARRYGLRRSCIKVVS